MSQTTDSIRPVTGRHWLLPTSYCRPSISLPYGWLARHCTGRRDGLSTFHVIDFAGNLGGTWTPVAKRSRGRHVSDLPPGHAHQHQAVCLRPANSRRSDTLTTRTILCLFSPYCPALALNRRKLPERFACRQLNPIRYVVRGASHQPHSAWQARPRRALAGIRQVLVLQGVTSSQIHTITRLRVANNAEFSSGQSHRNRTVTPIQPGESPIQQRSLLKSVSCTC